MSVKKIKCITQSCSTEWLFVSLINWFLKLYHQDCGQSKLDYEWTQPITLTDLKGEQDLHEACDLIVQEQIDVLAVSLYVWNRAKLFNLVQQLKLKLPNLVVVIGGPEVEAHRDPGFFKKENFIDYAVYGDGEIAFSRLLDHLAGYPAELINLVDGSGKVYPHEVFMDREIFSKSIILKFQEEIRQYFNTTKEKAKIYAPDVQLATTWETTKGCAFKCSFCDWSSGLHNKVRIWGKGELDPPWKKELLFFTELGIKGIYWTNANIGMSFHDEDIVNFWCDLKLSNPDAPVCVWPSMSKKNKQKTFKLIDKMLESNVVQSCRFDLQDLDPVVLNNIDRPEIPWEEHRVLIQDLLARRQDKLFRAKQDPFFLNAHLIWGLPGQTLNHWHHNAREVIPLGLFPYYQPFELLPNSPAANIEYQKKFNIKTKKIKLDNREFFTVTESLSMTEKEWFTGMLLMLVLNKLTNITSTMAHTVTNADSLVYNNFATHNIDIDALFFNFIKWDEIINDSYSFFQKTNEVSLRLRDQEIPLMIDEKIQKVFFRKLGQKPMI